MDWLKCNICFNTYNESILRPRSLSCGHTFCERCLNNTIQNENLTCPQCRKIHEINSASDLPINFTLEGLIKSLNVCSQDVNEGAVSKPTEGESIIDDKSETHGSLKSLLEQQEISLSAQKELIKTSAGLCYEHPSKECLFRCSKHMSWVCEQCIEDKGVHPKHKCQIRTFKEEIEDRKHKQKISLEKDGKSCDETLSKIESHISYLRDERERHISLISSLQDLVNIHKKEDNNLKNEMICFYKIAEEGKNVKQKLIDHETIVLNATTLDESNTARDIVRSKEEEADKWINTSCKEVDEGKLKIGMSTSSAMATEMALEYREKSLLLQLELEENVNKSRPNDKSTKMSSNEIEFIRKFDDCMLLILEPPVVFLTLTSDGTKLGQVHIRLDIKSYPRHVKQFVELVTGKSGFGSFKNSGFNLVGHKDQPEEWLACQGYINSVGKKEPMALYELKEKSDIQQPITVGDVYGMGKPELDSGFVIRTDSSNRSNSSIAKFNIPIFGHIIYGMKLLQEVIRKYSGRKLDTVQHAIDIKISECGVVLM